MFKRSLLAVAAALLVGSAGAATQTFDNFASGTVMTSAIPGLTFREPLSNGGVPITVAGFGNGNVLALNGNIAFNARQGAIDISFTTPQRSVSISATAWREQYYLGVSNNRPFLEAYDSAGVFLGRVLYQGAIPAAGALGGTETLTFVSASANIARIRLSTQANVDGYSVDGIFDTLSYSLSSVPSGVLYDDFSAVRKGRWTRSTTGGGIASAITGGQLAFEVSPAISGADVVDRWTATCQLSGDFDLRADYTVSGKQSGVRAALVADGAGHVERTSLSRTDIYTAGEYYITDISGYVPGFVSTADNQGGLRLQRTGNVMTSYYRSGSSGTWKAIYSQYVSTADLTFGLQVWTHDWAYARQGAAASFDNLMLASGRFVGFNCPQ